MNEKKVRDLMNEEGPEARCQLLRPLYLLLNPSKTAK
jgi:hypothetical protein